MAHTFTRLYFHVVFSTKLRRPIIPMELRPKLWSYMGGIARENKARGLAIGGMSDHAHLLLSLTPDMAVAKAVQVVKAGSSGWMSDLLQRDFKWQLDPPLGIARGGLLADVPPLGGTYEDAIVVLMTSCHNRANPGSKA
jgi:REP element-mobilizing transposase RayT